METCKTCKYWGRHWKGACDFVDTSAAEQPETRFEIKVKVLDDSGLSAWLLTGPDFGCIHHAKKPT